MITQLVENIGFKRHQPTKRSLNIGDGRYKPTIYTGYSRWWRARPNVWAGKKELLDKYQKTHDFLKNVDYYDVFLIDRQLSNLEIHKDLSYIIDMDELNKFKNLRQLIAGVEETHRTIGPIFHILWINQEEWNDKDIEDLRVITANGGNSAVNIVDVI